MATTYATSTHIKDVVKRSYDKIAPAYMEWTLSRTSPRLKYLEHLLRTLSPGSKVLEVGCGYGHPVTLALCENSNVSKVVANDISEAQIRLAKERCAQYGNKVQFDLGDMMVLKFEERELDGVAAFFSIFHLPKTEQAQMIGKIYSWLRPGGLLVCNFSAGNSDISESGDQLGIKDHTEERTEMWNYFKAEMFWSGLGTEGSKKMIEDAGFELLVADIRNANKDIASGTKLDVSDPDRDVEFLWVVARKPTSET